MGEDEKTESYEPSETERKIIKRVQERIASSSTSFDRWELEKQMYRNIAMYCGVQWLDIDDMSRRVRKYEPPSWFPTPVTNLIAPRVSRMLANIVRSRPQGRVRPTSSDPRDREAAQVAEQMLQHLYQVTKEEVVRLRAALLAVLTGTVIVEDTFNPRAGQQLVVPRVRRVTRPVMMESDEGPIQKVFDDGTPAEEEVEEPELDEAGEPVVDVFHEGEVESRVVSLFNFYWDPKAKTLDEARWCGEALFVDIAWIQENFPEYAKYVKPTDDMSSFSFFETALLDLTSENVSGGIAGKAIRNGVVVRKYQEKPSAEHPDGLYVIVAGDVLVYSGSLMVRDHTGKVTGDFTYTEFRYDEVPGRFPGRTPVDDLCKLQRRVNAIDSQVILNRRTLLNPWVLAPKGSGLNPGQVAMRPGATVLYNIVGGMEPRVVPGVPLPAQILEERAQAIQAMDELVHEATAGDSGQLPPGLRSGIALSFLRELQQEQLVPRLNRWGQWVVERDRKRLLLAQQYYREPRAIKLLGVGSDWQVMQWKGSDIRGNTDVTVDPGTLVPRAQSVKTQMLFDGIEAGLVDPRDPVQRQLLIERLDLRDFETEIGPDQRRARKENSQMEAGIPAELTPFENKQLHLAEHVARVKDPSFDALPDHVRALFMKHIEETEKALADEESAAKARDEEELNRRLTLAERAQAVGVRLRDLEAPQGMMPQLGGRDAGPPQ